MEVEFQFESGTRCAVCGLYHADQWVCDASIPRPWTSDGWDDSDNDEARAEADFGKKVGW